MVCFGSWDIGGGRCFNKKQGHVTMCGVNYIYRGCQPQMRAEINFLNAPRSKTTKIQLSLTTESSDQDDILACNQDSKMSLLNCQIKIYNSPVIKQMMNELGFF